MEALARQLVEIQEQARRAKADVAAALQAVEAARSAVTKAERDKAAAEAASARAPPPSPTQLLQSLLHAQGSTSSTSVDSLSDAESAELRAMLAGAGTPGSESAPPPDELTGATLYLPADATHLNGWWDVPFRLKDGTDTVLLAFLQPRAAASPRVALDADGVLQVWPQPHSRPYEICLPPHALRYADMEWGIAHDRGALLIRIPKVAGAGPVCPLPKPRVLTLTWGLSDEGGIATGATVCKPCDKVSVTYAVNAACEPAARSASDTALTAFGASADEAAAAAAAGYEPFPGPNDYIALYAAGDSPLCVTPGAEFWLTYTDGAPGGRVTLTLPSLPGPRCYVLRYIHGPSQQVLGSSSIIKVDSTVEKKSSSSSGEAAAPAPLIVVPPPPTPTVSDWCIPSYILEKQPRISVYQLFIRLPSVVCAERGARPRLPPTWKPVIHLTEAGPDGRGTRRLTVEYEIPACGRFRLCLDLVHRIEAPKVSWALECDHMLVRLPLYFQGASVPDRPARFTSKAELAQLSAPGVQLACKECGAHLLADQPPATSSQSPLPLRALLLPSETWLDWSDFWLCHGDEKNKLIPSEDYGVIKRIILLGETFMRLHPDDLAVERLLVRQGAAAGGTDSDDGSAGEGSGSHAAADIVKPAAWAETHAAQSFVDLGLYCRRCLSSLGVLSLPSRHASQCLLQEAGDGGSHATSATTWWSFRGDNSTASSPPPVLSDPSLHLPDKFGLGVGPVFSLYKDCVALPSVPATVSTLARYHTSTRVCERIVTALNQRQVYRFQLVPLPQGSAAADRAAVALRVRLSVLSWNTSVAIDGDKAADGSSSSRSSGQDIVTRAALKVRFSVGGGGAGGSAGADHQALPLAASELALVVSHLEHSHTLLPPSCAFFEGERVGYLFFQGDALPAAL